MNISADSLHTALKPLKPCYIVSGDEILLVNEATDQIRKTAHLENYARESYTITTSFNWDILRETSHLNSLFHTKKFIECYFQQTKIAATTFTACRALIEDNPNQHTFLFIFPKLDSGSLKTAAFIELEKHAIAVQIWPIDRDHYPPWVKQRLKNAGLTTDSRFVETLCELTEGNLLVCQQTIERLRLLKTDEAGLYAALEEGALFTMYDWISSILMGDAARSLHVLQHLNRQGEEMTLLLWVLCVELRLAADAQTGHLSFKEFCQKNRIWPKRQAAFKQFLTRVSLKKLYDALEYCSNIDKSIKGAIKSDPWQQLITLTLQLTSTA